MSGLTISRRVGESFTAGDVCVRVVKIQGGRVRVQIDAPPEIVISRDESRDHRKSVDRTEGD